MNTVDFMIKMQAEELEMIISIKTDGDLRKMTTSDQGQFKIAVLAALGMPPSPAAVRKVHLSVRF